MAKDKKGVSPRTSVDTLNETLTSVEQKVESNKKIIVIAVAAVVVIAGAVLAYIYGYQIPRNNEAKVEIGKVESGTAVTDSLALETYMNVADQYGNATGNRATLQSATILYKQGKYEEAINYLEKYDTKDALVGAASQSLLADCYVNTERYDEALSAFDKAISLSDNNELYTPIFMFKKATVLNETGDFQGAVKIYEEIKKEYPSFEDAYGVVIDKYLEKSKVQAGSGK